MWHLLDGQTGKSTLSPTIRYLAGEVLMIMDLFLFFFFFLTNVASLFLALPHVYKIFATHSWNLES